MTTIHNTIHVACAVDNSYTQHLGTMITSLCKNNKGINLHIHVFSAEFSDWNKKIIEDLLKSYNAGFSFYAIQSKEIEGFFISHHVSTATYYRLLIPHFMPNELEKVLYLDADIIVKKSLLKLWETNIEGYVVAAVREPSLNHFNRLGLPPDTRYFNAGVLLINLKEWRKRCLTSVLVNYVREKKNSLLFWDQDALNALLFQDWVEVPPKWNQQSAIFEKDHFTLQVCYSSDDLYEARYDPCIVHYTGSSKPWHYLNFHPQKELYWEYLRLSRWKDYAYPNVSVFDRIKKPIVFLLSPYYRRKLFNYFHLC